MATEKTVTLPRLAKFKEQLDSKYKNNILYDEVTSSTVTAIPDSEIDDTKSSTVLTYSSKKVEELIANSTPNLDYATDDDIHAMFTSTSSTTESSN